jgi:hypothetical protein
MEKYLCNQGVAKDFPENINQKFDKDGLIKLDILVFLHKYSYIIQGTYKKVK